MLNSLYNRRRSLATLALSGLVLAGLTAYFSLKDRPSSLPSGAPETWIAEGAKQAVALALNKGVTLPDFKAQLKKVGKGENYWGLARQAGVNIDTLVALNPELRSLQARLGKTLLVANKIGAIYITVPGDNVASIEQAYSLAPGTLRSANRFGSFGLASGKLLFLPGAKPKPSNDEMRALYARRNVFRSPLKGRYTSLVSMRVDPFTGDYRRHNGVDIKAPFNDLVAAAADGVVISASWSGGLGKAVKIKHADGYETVYGHLNAMLVKGGQHVKQHQFVGRVGSTGRTTGPHLHFTIYKDGKIQDPLKYLW